MRKGAMWKKFLGFKRVNKKVESMKKSGMTCAALVAALMLASCGSSKKIQNSDQVKGGDDQVAVRNDQPMDEGYLILSDSQRDIVRHNNTFALNLFRQVAGADNKVVSPLSVSYLMGMLANGADGQTRQEILEAIDCKGMGLDELNEFYKMMLTYGSKSSGVTLNIANYIALNQPYQVKDAFAKSVRDNYNAGIESLDFSASSAAKHINQWCSKHTGGMIPSLIDRTDPNAVSYLMNAIYFNGSWSDKFDKKQTQEENFQGYTRDIKKTMVMHRNAKYMYMDNDLFAAVNIPYGNGSYKMTILLPNPDKSIDEVLKSLDANSIGELSRKMDDCVVDLKLPRFRVETDQPLNEAISKLGAPSVFSSQADFHNFADGKLFVSKMFQKAKIEVTEEGTKAAAVTAAIMTMSAFHPDEPRHVSFHATRPFLYVITESSTGAILFMGQYTGSDI